MDALKVVLVSTRELIYYSWWQSSREIHKRIGGEDIHEK